MKINKKLSSLKLSRAQKILLTLFKLSKGTNKQVRFEDIAVGVFKNFPADFQLRGYPQYPDTGDIVHKPLYSGLKKKGYVLSGNKYFSLTPNGIAYAKELLNGSPEASKDDSNSTKLSASQRKEIERIQGTKAVELFFSGKKDEILDIDFYAYLAVTVRTNKYDFLGRLKTVEDAIEATKGKNKTLYEKLIECHRFLLEKFKSNVDFVKQSKGGKR
jgi:hypothetical protein